MQHDPLQQNASSRHDALFTFERTALDRLRLAADVILSDPDALPDPSKWS